MRLLTPLLAVLIAAGVFVGLDRSWPIADARIPPPGRFLDPFGGLWARPASDREVPERLSLPGLHGPVTVLWDERDVPHVFAEDDRDLYLAQGWLVARHRLWQMDFQALAAEGRIAEVVGPRALVLDRLQRRLGIPAGGERALEAARENPTANAALSAYAAGVNAWIDGLDPHELPLEYKLLDDRPRRWSPRRSVISLRNMARLLAMEREEVEQTRLRVRFGREVVESLFPTDAPFVDPIVPPGTPFEFEPLRPPAAAPFPDLAEPGQDGDGDETGDDGGLGSNHWVVGGARTASGLPILAGDPHLPLTLPSIWYEIHLHGPDQDVYGVTIPGVPGVIIGFNRHAAWSFTNAYSDAADWYVVRFRDETMEEYRHDGVWKPVRWREERIRVRGGGEIVDRVPWTHHGPVVVPPGSRSPSSSVPPGAALRWTAHDRSDEIGAILDLDRAATYDDLDEVLDRFRTPGQNVAFAFDDGRFGVVHAGRYPLRWPEQGRYVGDGSDPAFDWSGWIPTAQLPRVVDPERGFAGSANQPPTDGTYPYWLGWSYGRWERGARIHDLLREATGVTAEDMVRMQNDVRSEYARLLLPALLAQVPPSAAADDVERRILEDLADWDFRFAADATAPTAFDAWQRALAEAIWSDEFEGSPGRPLRRPRRDVTTAVVLAGDARWIDDRRTEAIESLRDVARSSFAVAVERLRGRLGEPGDAWAWGRVRGTVLEHLARLPGFGSDRLAVDGQYGVLRAVRTHDGPSFRMVVALGDPPRAWGEYPGGQNGDPASRRYLDGIARWAGGEVRELWYPDSPDERDAGRAIARSTLEPAP